MTTLFISVNMNQMPTGEYHWVIENPITKHIIDEGYALSPEAAFIAAKQHYDDYLLKQTTL